MQRKIKITEKIIDMAYRIGIEYEKSRHYCSQCVVATLQEVLQIKDDALFRAAYPLAGGLGNSTKGNCGALSGGAMIIGYFYGRTREEFKDNIPNKKAMNLTKKLYNLFIKEYGSFKCEDIQTKLFGRSFDFWNEQDRQAFEKAGGHREDKCPLVVAKAAVWTLKIIQEELNLDSAI